VHLIALTSVPPRFGGLERVLQALLVQGADRVILTIPESYSRFPEWDRKLPDTPAGVDLFRSADFGPATKLLPVLEAYPKADSILICDDDWIYGPGWADAFRESAREHPCAAIAGSCYDVSRLGLPGPGTVVQGFAGTLLRPAFFDAGLYDLPPRFHPVDDVWISGHLARRAVPVIATPSILNHIDHAENEADPLQNAVFNGETRADLNRAAAGFLAGNFGIWT
jgi:hypothetical protein